jgi:hypothetical protein
LPPILAPPRLPILQRTNIRQAPAPNRIGLRAKVIIQPLAILCGAITGSRHARHGAEQRKDRKEETSRPGDSLHAARLFWRPPGRNQIFSVEMT